MPRAALQSLRISREMSSEPFLQGKAGDKGRQTVEAILHSVQQSKDSEARNGIEILREKNVRAKICWYRK